MNTPTNVSRTAMTVWGGRLTTYVKKAGSGPDLVYFPATGTVLNDGLFAALTEQFTTHLIELPGTSPENTQAIHVVEDLWDLVLIYQEVITALSLDRPYAIGASFGGMLAAELAASFPDLFSKLALFDPLGLWRDDEPAPNWIAEFSQITERLFADAQSETATASLTANGSPDEIITATALRTWSLGCAGKFIWPLPDKGLSKRLHRITIPTLLLWGEEDVIAPPSYAQDFVDGIDGAQLIRIPAAGHLPHIEQPAAALSALRAFLA